MPRRSGTGQHHLLGADGEGKQTEKPVGNDGFSCRWEIQVAFSFQMFPCVADAFTPVV